MPRKKQSPRYSNEDKDKLASLLNKTFELTCDVVNPQADRRSKGDVRYTPVWKKGTRFHVKQWYGVDEAVFPSLEFFGQRYGNDLIWHDSRFYALVENAVETSETFIEFMEREGINGRMALNLLDRMERDGVTTRKYVKALTATLNAEWEAEDAVEEAARRKAQRKAEKVAK